MARPQRRITGQIGEIIESPIVSNFKEGLTVLEYFISTHGGRKGLADTALKTADAGYLTRRLVDVAQDVVIVEEDCGTILGQEMTPLKEGEKIIETLSERIVGKTALEDAINPLTEEVVVKAGEEITEERAQEIEESGLDRVRIRSVLTCEARRGLCGKCYGRNLATGTMVDIGEAVGIVAAQSIGEPGTQLTLRTFHIGGIATRITEESKAITRIAGEAHFENLRFCVRADGARIAISRNGRIRFATEKGEIRYTVPYGANVTVENKEKVEAGHILYEWDPYSHPIICERKGKVDYVDIVEDVTIREELDERTGTRQRVIVEHKEKTLHPAIVIQSTGKKQKKHYPIPTGAYVSARKGDRVSPGELLAKIPLEIGKTKDITGGLPRVAELFEARKPKDHAVVTEVDGSVVLGKVSKGTRPVTIVSATDEERTYQIPYGKHLRVVDGEFVRAGDKLSEGPLNPHDILNIKGLTGVQEYLVNDIQEVYRLQNVKIDDKHIGVIVRQMLQKIKIEDPGDTIFIEGETVDRVVLKEENERVIQDGGKPATFQPLLLGITKAALSTHSFISAASFQETTRVLAEAAIGGKKDSLLGLKENVIMGSLIPAGTGLKQYRKIQLEVEQKSEEETEEVEEAAAV
jgi:DNA-directed RNA polymerase subunit beta'